MQFASHWLCLIVCLFSTIPSILHNKPRIALQLAAWGDRLRQVLCAQWTIGAVTALDHWFAIHALEISEENWERMLAGDEDIGVYFYKIECHLFVFFIFCTVIGDSRNIILRNPSG